jgi:phosphatidylserine/phosphatidylglycerophosphate/cardiolipin synthase-like enzyme
VYFQSARAHVDGKATGHLVEFIKSAKERIDCAIYDLKDPDVVGALKSVAEKVTLRIAYDGGKQKEVTGGPSVDPKPKGTAQIIEESGLSEYATAIHVSGGHLMHSKYIIRDDDTVWTGSGNWTILKNNCKAVNVRLIQINSNHAVLLLQLAVLLNQNLAPQVQPCS